MALFPGAQVTSIRETEAPVAPAPDEQQEDPPVDPDIDFAAAGAGENETRPKTGKA
jgi:DNA polymerase III subunit gamma/tau